MNAPLVEVSMIAAFLAGVVSFLSPCVLPLIPGYLSLVTKLSYDELSSDCRKTSKTTSILLPSVLFGLGFTTVFVSLGVSVSLLGELLRANKYILLNISGVAIIILGLVAMEIIKIPQLLREKKINIQNNPLGLFGIFLLGAAFGFAWTPCIGPILATILIYASTEASALKGGKLLLIYSFGLGVPFIITGIAFNKALTTFKFVRKHYVYYKYIVGVTLISIGVLMLLNKVFYLNIYGQKILDIFGIDFWQRF